MLISIPPSVFGALLDDRKGGRFSVSPEGDWESRAGYLKTTNILRTNFRTRTGIVHLTDFMPVPHIEEEDIDAEPHELYRLVETEQGTVEVHMLFEPKFDYAREIALFYNRCEGGYCKERRRSPCPARDVGYAFQRNGTEG